MDEEFKIQLKLADKYYPYTCKRSEEGVLRKAATNLNNRILKYSSYYSNANFELSDLLTLTGFQFSLEVLKNENKEDVTPLFNKIEQLNNELDEYLKNSR